MPHIPVTCEVSTPDMVFAGWWAIAAAASASDDSRASRQSDELLWNATGYACSAVRGTYLDEAGRWRAAETEQREQTRSRNERFRTNCTVATHNGTLLSFFMSSQSAQYCKCTRQVQGLAVCEGGCAACLANRSTSHQKSSATPGQSQPVSASPRNIPPAPQQQRVQSIRCGIVRRMQEEGPALGSAHCSALLVVSFGCGGRQRRSKTRSPWRHNYCCLRYTH